MDSRGVITEAFQNQVLKEAEELNVTRIDITFSKNVKRKDKKIWYKSLTCYLNKDEYAAYNSILAAFHQNEMIPIDFIAPEDIQNYNTPFFKFIKEDHTNSLTSRTPPGGQWEIDYAMYKDVSSDADDSGDDNPDYIFASEKIALKKQELLNSNDKFQDIQKYFSDLLFQKTSIKELIVFPYFSRSGLGSNCIIALSEIVEDEHELYKFLFQILSFISNESFDELTSLLRTESVKSAKAAIMSRNMSHNLGSHVMSYLKNHLGSVQSVLNDRVLSRLINTRSDLDNLFGREKVEENELTLPFLVGLGQFISYLQERQDFIATIATDYVPYFATINFKDSIYDELNNDKRFERHQDRKNLKPDNILLGNIARSEGLARRTCPTSDDNSNLSDIVIKFRSTFTGDPVEVVSVSRKAQTTRLIRLDVDEDTVKKATTELRKMQGDESESSIENNCCPAVCSIIKKVITASGDSNKRTQVLEGTPQPINFYGNDEAVTKAKSELSDMRKYEVSLPGGIVGRQAVFSIFENVIRNAAKHGNWRKQGKLELTIDIFSKEDVLKSDINNELKERLRDDRVNDYSLSLREVLSKYYCAGKDNEDDYYFVTLTDNLNVSGDSLESLRKALIEDYINEDSIMIDANKGIKEMRISAAWLRSINNDMALSPFAGSDDLINDRSWLEDGKTWDKLPPVLYARLSKNKAGRCNLQYIFCLMRPKRVAFISPYFTDTSNVKTRLQEKGWRLFTPSEYLGYKNKSFEIIVYNDKNSDTKLMHRVRLFSPKRFLLLSNVKDRAFFDKLLGAQDGSGAPISISDVEIDSAVNSLYQSLSKWNGSEMIFINDEKAKSNYNKIENKSKHISFEENENTYYRYVTHLESKKEFVKYVVKPEIPNCFVFSEGITGDNSTDRLVRNEALTDGWFFKHLYAMKQKIAIFDERIFSKVYGLEENDLIISPIEDYGGDLKKNKEDLKGLFNTPEDRMQIDKINNYNTFNFFAEQKSYNPETGSDMNYIPCRNHIGATYAFKNLYVFTIIQSIEKPKTFNIYGYQYDPLGSSEFSRCVKYATISWDNNIPYIKKEENVEWIEFDSLSIHQGLLDKMYGVFGIKKKKDKDRIKSKEDMTKHFYEIFTNCLTKPSSDTSQNYGTSLSIIEFKDKEKGSTAPNHYYLPGMTIHSGRSKPSKEDMPQWMPFIPYSAIEHAVHDCKYSVVELLDSARYE